MSAGGGYVDSRIFQRSSIRGILDIYQYLGRLSGELFENALNQKISRRCALSNLAKVAGAAALSFAAGGLMGYLLALQKERITTETKTLTSSLTIYRTETITQMVTSTETVTETYTTTKTERPEIEVEVRVGKSYDAAARDYEIGLEVKASEPLDGIKAYYENASVSGVLDRWERNELEYTSGFLTGREIGEQRIRLEVEKDGVRAEKKFSVNVALSEDEISESSLDRSGLKLLWGDLLEDERMDVDREEVLRREYEVVNALRLREISRITSLYLKEFATYLTCNQMSCDDVLEGLSLLLPILPSKP